ncbi:hypothetical protein XB05_14680 [Xanthomonas arboricola]|nr:hypothetical protein XB05_14680 [Xanthomonas arboricola]
MGFGTPGGWNSPFSEEEYPLHNRNVNADCYVFDTAEGADLVVPCWQILHAWYLFDPVVVPYVLAGMLDTNHNYGVEMPWLPGTQCQAGHVTYHARSALPAHVAVAMARLLFDRGANRSARMIHQKLMANRTRLPLIWPPYHVPTEWVFRARRLSPRNGRARWLLLHLHHVHAAPFFEGFELVKEIAPLEQTSDRKPVISRTGAPVAREVKHLALVGNRTGVRRAAAPSSFPALYFIDHGIESLSVTTRMIHREAERVAGTTIVLPNPELQIQAASLTTLGPEDKEVLAVRERSPEKQAQEAETLFKRSRRAFQAVIDYLAQQSHPQGLPWSGRFIESASGNCFFQQYPRKRHFLILELRIADQHTYVLDVHRKPDDEEFALAMVRRVGADALGPEHFHVWLKGFPFAGKDAWGNGSQVPRWLLAPVHVNHQTTQLPASIDALPDAEKEDRAEAHYVRLFRDRLIRRVASYL